jgi:chaperonin GroEL
VVFLRGQKTLKSLELEGDEAIGAQIISRALEEPLRQIVANAGIEGAIVVRKVADAKGANGFKARTEVYEDLIKSGVVDPAKVARTALQNGASIAALLLTTEALVADIPEKAAAAAGGPPGGDMYGGGGMGGGMGGMM